MESLKFCVACTTSLLRWLWNDLLRLLPVAIFFLVGFNLIVLADKLMVFKHKTVAAAHQYAMHEVALPHFWGTEIWVAVLLLMFVTAQELIHAVGRDQIRRMFFGRWGQAEPALS